MPWSKFCRDTRPIIINGVANAPLVILWHLSTCSPLEACHGPMRVAKVYIPPERVHSLAICVTLPRYDPNSTMPFPTLFSHNTPQTSATTGAAPTRRRSTTISMMEEEFGMREPPQTATRFGERQIAVLLSSSGLIPFLCPQVYRPAFPRSARGPPLSSQSLDEIRPF
jgi:hypothetical protein